MELEHKVARGFRPDVAHPMQLPGAAIDDAERPDSLPQRFHRALECHDRDVVGIAMRLVTGTGFEHADVSVELAQAVGRSLQ